MSFLVAALGLVVLSGWAFNVPTLTNIRPTLQSMKVNTALSFLCLGAGLWLAQNDKRQRSRRILGLSVVVIAGLTLAEYAFHINLGIDQILFRNTHIPSLSAYPGRMAIATATCLLLLGLAVTFLGRKKAIALQHTFVVSCLAFSVVALCGYLYGAKSLYSITSFSTVGVHTAAGLFAASLAYFLARPDEGIVSVAASDTNSGLLLRTLFPAIIVVNILIGWLRLEGQRANLYDAPFGVALLVLVSIGCLTALTVLVARSMHRLESEHSRGEAARIRSAAIVESSDDAIIGTDSSGTVTDWNKGAERLFGYLASEAIGKNISFLAAADQLDQAQRIFEKVTSRDVVRHHETVRRRKDGTQVEISLTASPIVDAEGRIVGVSGITRDITAQKGAEDALRLSEERFRLAAQAGKMYAYEWDVTTDVLVRSSEYVKILGVAEPQHFTRQQFMDKIHPDDRPRFIAAIAGLTPCKPTGEVTYRVLLPAGAVVWLKNSGRAFFDGEGRMVRVIGMVADVTDHKLSEEKLREYEKAVEGLEEMIVVVDREYRYLVANRKFLSMRHLAREQVVGRFAHEVVNRGAYEAIVKERLDECFRGNAVRYEMKYTYPEIGERDILISYFPIEGVNGIDRAACIFQDITERKQAEEALANMTRKLIDAQEQERARIARELHDDINQRLAMLGFELEQLKENPSEIESRVEELRKQTAEISNDVEALSHDLHSSKLEYLGVVAGMKSWCKEFGERRKMDVDFSSDVRSVLSLDVGRPLFRVLQEALYNAFKHSGVKRIEVLLREEAGEIHLIVSDSGKGFDVEAASQGKGLGLTSMRERVRLVNGTISIESKPMGGTTIHVRAALGSEKLSERAVD